MPPTDAAPQTHDVIGAEVARRMGVPEERLRARDRSPHVAAREQPLQERTMNSAVLVPGLIGALPGMPSRLSILAALLALAGLGGLLLVHRWYARSGLWVTVAASLTSGRATPATKGATDAHAANVNAR